MSVVSTSKLARVRRGALWAALLGIGMVLGGCVENEPDVDDEADTEQVGGADDALVSDDVDDEGSIELDDADAHGDIGNADLEEPIQQLESSELRESDPAEGIGAPRESHDPSPQPWQPVDDDQENKASHLF
ncbi:MAG: hypothetical protein HOW73_19185 [Polyangiaceae bacterium]|nr:hypothetical protein [Polyangiaceae bacterium]